MSDRPLRAAPAALAAALVLAASAWAGAAFGAQDVSLWRALREPASLDRLLLVAARLPRVALALIAGGGLSVVGVAFQGLLRNPLAEPFLLGVSGGAALGASIALVVGVGALPLIGPFAVPAAALAGGLGATAVVYGVARAAGPSSSATLLLAGVIVNAIAASAVTLLKSLVSATKAQTMLFWLVGFLGAPSSTELAVLTAFVAAGSVALYLDAARLNLLALGDEAAGHLGVDVARLERRVFFASSAIVGGIVSLTGLIGFVGLVVPHVVRRLVGPDNRLLVPLSFALGGALLVLCDLGSRLAFLRLGREPPVGAVTALLGGPFFLLLLARRTR